MGLEMSKKFINNLKPYIWLIPSLFLFGVFTFYPFFHTIYKSFFIVDSMGKVREFVGFGNYLYVLNDKKFLIAITNTLIFLAITVPTSKVLGFCFALLANKKRKFSTFYEASFALPMAMASSVVAMIFQLLYVYPLGILNGRFHLDIRWLTDSKYALIAIAIVQIWLSTGYAFVFLLSAVRNVSNDLLESASIDGASPLKKIFSIYIPLTTPTLFYLLVSDLAYTMMIMGLVNILTGGGPNNSTLTIMLYIYQQFARTGNYTTANAASIFAFLLSLTFTLIAFVWEKKGVHYQ